MPNNQVLSPKVVTIDRLEQFTHQEIFTFIAIKLIQQAKQSVDSNNSCRYRSEQNGTIICCAIGHIIPDALYKKI